MSPGVDDLDTGPPGDNEPLPERGRIALEDVASLVDEASAAADTVLTPLDNAIRTDLDAGEALVSSLTDELAGAMDLSLSDAEAKVIKAVATWVSETERPLTTATNYLLDVGINPPWHVAEQRLMLDGDWLSLVTTAIPRFGDALYGPQSGAYTDPPDDTVTGGTGPVPTVPPPPFTVKIATDPGPGVPTVPVTIGAPGFVPQPPPPVPPGGFVQPAPRFPNFGPGFTPQPPPGPPVPPGGFVQVPVPVPVYGPVPPPVPPGPCGCPPPDVNVYVTVPPAPPADCPDLPPPMAPPGPPPPPGPPVIIQGPPGSSIFSPPPPPVNVTVGGPTVIVPPPAGGGFVQPPATGPVVPQPSPPIYVPGMGIVPGNPFFWTPQQQQQYLQTLPLRPVGPGGEPLVPEPPGGKPIIRRVQDVLDFPASTLQVLNWNDIAACAQAFTLSTSPTSALIEGMRGSDSKDLFSKLLDDVIGDNIFTRLLPSQAPNRAAALYYGAKLGVAAEIEKRTGFPLQYLMGGERLMYQYANPQDLPNQIRIDDAYLNGIITRETWACWTRAIGNLPGPAEKTLLANQARPDVGDLITLWRRGEISREKLYERCRERGVLDAKYVDDWVKASALLPTQSDLIRFMVRDASDDAVSKEFGYDTDFDEKYTPQIRAWAKSLGIDETYFRYSWRSHWEIPSYTQLSEMFHRLRPDRAEVKSWDLNAQATGVAQATKDYGPRPPTVTLDQMRQALQINDVAPRWVDALIATSYTPINRTDAIRAYQIGAFDEARLRDAFLDVGYSPADSDTLVAFHRQDKARRRANVTGGWSPRRVLAYYKRGALTRETAAELLKPLMADQQEVRRTLDGADQEQEADTRAAAVRGVRRGFMAGEFSEASARTALTGFKAGAQQITSMLTQWVIDRDTRYKRLSASQATAAMRDGLISVADCRQRLINLGYVAADADVIVARGLKVQGDGDGMTAADLDTAIQDVVKTRAEAKRQNDGYLTRRLKALYKEAARIVAELNKRRRADNEPALPEPPKMN